MSDSILPIADVITVTVSGADDTIAMPAQSDSNLDVQIDASGDLVSINIQPASFTGTGGSGAVASVNGQTGVVVLTTTDVSEGVRLYYTDVRADARIEPAVTAGVVSANAYTDAQVASAVLDIQTDIATGDSNTLTAATAYTDSQISSVAVPVSTDDLPEGTSNLYSTTARIQAVIDQNTAGFITDYTVTESDVVAHQAALSITQSQIADLVHYTSTDFDTDFDSKTATDLQYDNTGSGLTASNVGAAITELALEKVNISDLAASITVYPTTSTFSHPSTGELQFLGVSSITAPEYNSTAVDVTLPECTTDDQMLGAVAIQNLITGNPGYINVHTIGNIRKSSGSGSSKAALYFTISRLTVSSEETLLGTSSATPQITTDEYQEFFADCILSTPETFQESDWLLIRYYCTDVQGTPGYQIQFGGTSPVRTNLPVSAQNIVFPAPPVPTANDIYLTDGSATNFTGHLAALTAEDTVLTALQTLDGLTIPDEYTDAQAISALENNSATTLTGNLTVTGDFVSLAQVYLNNFEFPVVDYGRTDQWAGSAQTIDISNAYVKFQLRGSTTPSITFDTSNFFDNALNLRTVHMLIDYHSGPGMINWPADLTWQSGSAPNFAGGIARDRYLLKLMGSGDRGWSAHLEQVFNPNATSPTTNLKFNKLTDLNITDGTAGQVLSTNADGTFTFIDQTGGSGGGASALADLTDVNIVSVADGDLLRYNGTAAEWQNTNLGLSLTPELSADATQYISGSASISNWAEYTDPAVYAELLGTGGGVVRTNSEISVSATGVLTWQMPSTPGVYTLSVQVQDFGDLASDTASIEITRALAEFRYWRIQNAVAKAGQTSTMITEFRLYSASAQSGTVYPSNMTSDTAPSPYVSSASYFFNATYAPWKAFDSSITSQWWTLSTPNGVANDWLQIDLGSAQTINSVRLRAGSEPYVPQSVEIWASNDAFSTGVRIATVTVAIAATNVNIG
jgi:hypothetical protein